MKKSRLTGADVKQYDIRVLIPGSGGFPACLCYQSANGYNYGLFGWNWDMWEYEIDGNVIAVLRGYRVPKTLYNVCISYDDFTMLEHDCRRIMAAVKYGGRAERAKAEFLIGMKWKKMLEGMGVKL